MGKSRVSGPGRMGSVAAVKKSLKKSGSSKVKIVPKEGSLTVRFLDEPEDFHGYYEHYVNGEYRPCVTDECEGCTSDDPDEQRRMFRYLANAYVVDDQKVMVLKLPKTLVEALMVYHEKYDGTLRDRDYDLRRTGSGQNDTKYFAAPDSPTKLKLSRFESKMLDLEEVVNSMLGDDDEDDEDEKPSKKKSGKSSKPKKREKDPWEDEDEDDEDDKPRKKKKSSASVKSKGTVKKRVAPKKTTVKRTVRRK